MADDYRVEKGMIRPLIAGTPVDPHFAPKGGGENYLPLARPELPGEFSRVDDEDDALKFVKRYGLLGYNLAFRFMELAGAVLGRLHPQTNGDPVAWILAHARTVRLVMDLAEMLDNPPALTARVEQLLKRNPSTGAVSLSYTVANRGYLKPSDASRRYDRDVRKAALGIIAGVLQNNLEGISRAPLVEVEEGGSQLGLSTIFVPRNLLDCIYWMLADAVQAGTVRACASCRRPFVAHGKMKYCPPLLSQEVSACMNRDKQRRFRLATRAREMRADGLPIKRIAEELEAEEQQVRKWAGPRKGAPPRKKHRT